MRASGRASRHRLDRIADPPARAVVRVDRDRPGRFDAVERFARLNDLEEPCESTLGEVTRQPELAAAAAGRRRRHRHPRSLLEAPSFWRDPSKRSVIDGAREAAEPDLMGTVSPEVHANPGASTADRYHADRLGAGRWRESWRAETEAALDKRFRLNSFTPDSAYGATMRDLLKSGLQGPWWGSRGPAYRRVFQQWVDKIQEDFGPRTEITRAEMEQVGANLTAVTDVIEGHCSRIWPIRMWGSDHENMKNMITSLREISRAFQELAWTMHPLAKIDLT